MQVSQDADWVCNMHPFSSMRSCTIPEDTTIVKAFQGQSLHYEKVAAMVAVLALGQCQHVVVCVQRLLCMHWEILASCSCCRLQLHCLHAMLSMHDFPELGD